MEIIVFILLAGVWAAFLLPSFFEHRRQAPVVATRDFARSKQLLASVSSTGATGTWPGRRRAQLRRRNAMVAMSAAAAATLVLAVVTGSVFWLALTIVLDVGIATFVALVLHVQQHRSLPGVARMPVEQITPRDAPDPVEETPTVRVIAG